MSHGVITLIITGCDQYPGNCWIAVPFLGDSFQQFNDITNVPTFSFDPWLLRMKSLHLFSSPRTTLLFCGIYFCFTIILSPLSDSQFSIFDIQFIVFQYQNGVNQGLLEVCNNCCAATRLMIHPALRWDHTGWWGAGLGRVWW